jgi:hypothetical protein
MSHVCTVAPAAEPSPSVISPVASDDALTSVDPASPNATAKAGRPSSRTFTSASVSVDHNLIVLSRPALATSEPSGEAAISVTPQTGKRSPVSGVGIGSGVSTPVFAGLMYVKGAVSRRPALATSSLSLAKARLVTLLSPAEGKLKRSGAATGLSSCQTVIKEGPSTAGGTSRADATTTPASTATSAPTNRAAT